VVVATTAAPTTSRHLDEKPHVYDAFFSYSHAADGRLAPSLQTGVQSLARPWYRRRALRVFRDQTSLTATPELWGTIESALETSRFFVLLASPEAAASRWVGKEASWWREHRGPATFLIVLTAGELLWDDVARDFDWNLTDALPESLAGFFEEEPLWVDLRWAHEAEHLSPGNGRFRDHVADLAAPIRGQPKDELLGEDIRQHRRTIRLATGAAISLAVLLVAATAAAVVALNQRNTAREQARIAQSRQLAASASELLRSQPDLALALAIRAVETEPTMAADTVLRQATLEAPAATLLRNSDDAKVAAFSADGRRIATGDGDGRIRIWRSDSGRLLRVMRASRPGRAINVLEFSPDGRRLMAADDYDGDLHLYVTATGKRTAFPGHDPGATPPDAYLGGDWSSDGSHIATASNEHHLVKPFKDSEITVWDTRSGASTLRLRGPSEDERLSDPVFSPDGKLLAAVAAGSGQPYLWDVRSGRPVGALPKRADTAWSVALGEKGRFAVAYSFTVIVGDVRGGGHRVAIKVPGGCPCTMHFSADDRRLAITSMLDLRVFDARTGRRTDVFRQESPLSGRPFDPTGPRVVSTRDGGPARVIGLDRAQPADILSPDQFLTWSLAFSPDGKRVASAGETRSGAASAVRISDVKTGRQLHEIGTLPSKAGFSTGLQDVAFGAGGLFLAATDDGDTLRFFDPITGRQLWIVQRGRAELDKVASALGDTLVATAGLSGVRLWRVGNDSGGRFRVQGAGRLSFNAIPDDVAISPDGSMVAAVLGTGPIRIYDAKRRRLLAKLSIPQVSLTSAAFSYDGRRLVTAAGDQTIRVWDVESWRQELTLRGQDGTVDTAEFSPDGNWILAAGASDGTVRVWSAHRGEESIVLDRGAYSAATFGPDGGRVLAAGGDVRLIDCAVCDPLEHVVRVAKRRSTRTLTAAERATFLP
jgi:WD40 repeat protein